MGAASAKITIVDDNTVVNRARAEELAGAAFSEDAWQAAAMSVTEEGVLSGLTWNRLVQDYMLTSSAHLRPGLDNRDLANEVWFFAVGTFANKEVLRYLGIVPIMSLPGEVPNLCTAFVGHEAVGVAASAAVATDSDGANSNATPLPCVGIAHKISAATLEHVVDNAFACAPGVQRQLVRARLRRREGGGTFEVECWCHMLTNVVDDASKCASAVNVAANDEAHLNSGDDAVALSEDHKCDDCKYASRLRRPQRRRPEARLVEAMIQAQYQYDDDFHVGFLARNDSYVARLRELRTLPRPLRNEDEADAASDLLPTEALLLHGNQCAATWHYDPQYVENEFAAEDAIGQAGDEGENSGELQIKLLPSHSFGSSSVAGVVIDSETGLGEQQQQQQQQQQKKKQQQRQPSLPALERKVPTAVEEDKKSATAEAVSEKAEAVTPIEEVD